MLPGELPEKDAKGHTVFQCFLCNRKHGTFEGESLCSKWRICFKCQITVMKAHCEKIEQPRQKGLIDCPKCRSSQWKTLYRSPIEPAEDKFQCIVCKHQWKRYDH